MVEDALFATLDPTVRRTQTEDGRAYTLSDTVGFVSRLPTQLVEAFRSTLEEVGEANVILHVVDAAHPDPIGQIQAVHSVLDTIEGARDIPELIVFNKADLASDEQRAFVRSLSERAVLVSAVTGEGISELQKAIASMLPRPREVIDCVVPYIYGALTHRIHEEGEVLAEEYLGEGERIRARVDGALAAAVRAVALPLQGESPSLGSQGMSEPDMAAPAEDYE